MQWFYVFKGDGGTLYSPEFPRGGLAALFGANILQVFSSPTLLLSVDGRNHDETSFTNMGTFSNITTGGLKQLDLGNLKEILRFGFTISAATAAAGVAIEMVAPQWRPYS